MGGHVLVGARLAGRARLLGYLAVFRNGLARPAHGLRRARRRAVCTNLVLARRAVTAFELGRRAAGSRAVLAAGALRIGTRDAAEPVGGARARPFLVRVGPALGVAARGALVGVLRAGTGARAVLAIAARGRGGAWYHALVAFVVVGGPEAVAGAVEPGLALVRV